MTYLMEPVVTPPDAPVWRTPPSEGKPLKLDEPATVNEAFRAWGVSVWRVLRYCGVSPRSLSDATQDVFLVAHQRWGTFRGGSTRKVWVLGIARNVGRHYARQRRKPWLGEPEADSGAIHELSAPNEASCPAALASQREQARLLESLLAELPEEMRLVVTLVEIEDCSVREAAETLDIPLRRARWLLDSAKERLAKALKRSLGDQ